jgi:hypothetical protein
MMYRRPKDARAPTAQSAMAISAMARPVANKT